jgi:iron complex outermembrane receptor protein
MPLKDIRFLFLLLPSFLTTMLWGQAVVLDKPSPQLSTKDLPIVLNPLLVTAEEDASSFDQTGMGTMEMEMDDPPFSNDLLAGNRGSDEIGAPIDVELSQINNPNPGDLSITQSRVDIRGFPSPRLRNGFTQMGINEVLNIERSEQIVGPLASVSGRSAPGGISNYVTGRPRAKPNGLLSLSFGTQNNQRLGFDVNRVLKPKRLWTRVSGTWYQKHGPETFTYYRQRTLSNSYTWKASKLASFMLQLDYADYRSNPSGGVPEFRTTRTGKIQGPYLPLALFHSYGPNALQLKKLGSIAVQYEGQPCRWLSLRSSGQYFYRRFTEDRFTRGEYLLDERVFSGIREPIHTEQPFDAFSGQIEATARFRALKAEHKFLVSLEGSQVDSDRLQRALNTNERSLYLPATVLTFDPAAPDYTRPAYSPELYKRVLADRSENSRFSALALSERAAFANGRIVATLGLRQDWVDLSITDRRSSASIPYTEDSIGKLSRHAGANYVVKPGRLLLFANTSTAFEPSFRVDARTGQIQGNETTQGYETGATGLSREKTIAYTFTFFTYTNKNIARKNPLYGSPIYDADQTQPQLVSAGAERFRGGVIDLRWRPIPSTTFSARETYTEAITTASPDLPEEVGRQLTRLPKEASTLSVRYAPISKTSTGPSLGLSATYIGPYTAYYESSTRSYLHYPGYTQFTASAGYRWNTGRFTHSLSLSVRNLLNTDLLEKLARTGARRELATSYALSF